MERRCPGTLTSSIVTNTTGIRSQSEQVIHVSFKLILFVLFPNIIDFEGLLS